MLSQLEPLQKAQSIENLPSQTDETLKIRSLVLRRSMLLAVAGGTPSDSPSLEQALARGYLDAVKLWLDDILSGSIGKSIPIGWRWHSLRL